MCGKQANACKNGFVVFSFYIVGFEGKPPNFTLYPIRAWVFSNTAADIG